MLSWSATGPEECNRKTMPSMLSWAGAIGVPHTKTYDDVPVALSKFTHDGCNALWRTAVVFVAIMRDHHADAAPGGRDGSTCFINASTAHQARCDCFPRMPIRWSGFAMLESLLKARSNAKY